LGVVGICSNLYYELLVSIDYEKMHPAFIRGPDASGTHQTARMLEINSLEE
jgi:hypothetical protein